jgi:hypothetical protein
VLLTKANRDGLLTGVPTSKMGPHVNHLFFADDSLLFCRATIIQWSNLTNILWMYCNTPIKTNLFTKQNLFHKSNQQMFSIMVL